MEPVANWAMNTFNAFDHAIDNSHEVIEEHLGQDIHAVNMIEQKMTSFTNDKLDGAIQEAAGEARD